MNSLKVVNRAWKMSEKLNSCTLSSFLTGRQLDPGPLGVGVVGDHGGVVSGGPGHLAAVSVLLLQVADDGSLGHGADGHHVADGELGALAAVHELAGVHALNGHEQLLADLVSKKKSNGRGVSVLTSQTKNNTRLEESHLFRTVSGLPTD